MAVKAFSMADHPGLSASTSMVSSGGAVQRRGTPSRGPAGGADDATTPASVRAHRLHRIQTRGTGGGIDPEGEAHQEAHPQGHPGGPRRDPGGQLEDPPAEVGDPGTEQDA